MEQAQQNTAQELTAQAIPQQAVEDACFHSLGLIGRNCEYLEQHLARVGADAQSLQAVSDISAATAKLERTINELLSALEFLRAGQPPKLYPLDLCELLQQVAAQADMVRAQLGVTLELDYGGWTTCRVLADRDDVELLCLHLLSNALRACREGGTVRILLRRSETMWQLTVRDNGCGLPEGSQEAWLENRRSFLGGAQLGLLLCRECCRRMGWGLSVECAPEKGTQAVVTVPLYTDDGGGAACRSRPCVRAASVPAARHAGAGAAHHARARRPGRINRTKPKTRNFLSDRKFRVLLFV